MEKNTKIRKASVKKKIPVLGLKLRVVDLNGKEKESLELPKEIFSVKTNPALLAQYVRVYLANQRQGNASTKTRSEVAGSTRKIYRQKGTGRARHGARTAPIFVGGGIFAGPKPKDWSLKINKKQKRKALFGALTLKNKEGHIVGLTTASLKVEPKTKIVAGFLKKLGSLSKKTLFVLPKIEKNNFILAARNLENVELVDAKSVNPYLILKSQTIVLVKDSLSVMSEHFLKKNEN